MDMKREFYERVVISSVTCAAETLSMRVEEGRILDVIENKWSRSRCGVTRMGR